MDGDRELGERARHLGSRFLVPTTDDDARTPEDEPRRSVSCRLRHQIGFSLLRRALALADRRHSHRFRGVRDVPSGHSRLLYRRLRNTPRTRSSRVLLFPLDGLATSCVRPGTLAQARGSERFGWRNSDCRFLLDQVHISGCYKFRYTYVCKRVISEARSFILISRMLPVVS